MVECGNSEILVPFMDWNPDIREISGESINILTRSTKEICLELVKIVEKNISKEIQRAVGGAIVHYG